jgi:hypothetical protein
MNPVTAKFASFALAISLALLSGASASAESAKPVTASVKQSLEAKLLSGMRITTLKIDDKRADIKGVSPSNALVSEFLRNLTNSPSYTKVELVSIEQKNDNVSFQIVSNVQCPIAGSTTTGEKLCDKSAVKPSSVFKCTVGGKTVFQDRPCTKTN